MRCPILCTVEIAGVQSLEAEVKDSFDLLLGALPSVFGLVHRSSALSSSCATKTPSNPRQALVTHNSKLRHSGRGHPLRVLERIRLSLPPGPLCQSVLAHGVLCRPAPSSGGGLLIFLCTFPSMIRPPPSLQGLRTPPSQSRTSSH